MLGLSAGGAHWYFAGKIFQTGAHMRATRGIAFVITFAVACLVLSLKVGKKGFLVSESFSYKAQSTTAFIQQCWLFLPPGIQIELLSFAFERNEWKSNALVESSCVSVCRSGCLETGKSFLKPVVLGNACYSYTVVRLGVPTILQNFGKSYKKLAAVVNLLAAKSELVLHLIDSRSFVFP